MCFFENFSANGTDNTTSSFEFRESVTNEPCNNTEDTMPTPNYLTLLVVPIIFFVAMGNVLVIVSVALDSKLRSATNCFLSSLAIADLLVALTVMPPSLAMIINNYEWPFNDDLCGIWVMLDVFFSTSSILHLCMISFDRYMALARPFQHRNSRSTFSSSRIGALRSSQDQSHTIKRAAKKVVLVWVTAFGIAIPLFICGKNDRNKIFVGKMCTINFELYQIYASLVAFFLPLVIMFIMYTLTIRTLRFQARLVSSLLVHNGRNSPPNSGRSSSFRRKNSSQLAKGVFHKSPRLDHRFQRRESSLSMQEAEFESSKGGLMSFAQSAKRMKKSEDNETTWHLPDQATDNSSCKLMPFNAILKARRRLKIFLCFETMKNSTKEESLVSQTHGIHRRFSNACESDSTIREESDGGTQRSSLRLHRKYGSSVRRISTSFKNKAMKSITNEQRASKVLGLIFVLFCLFWCPFFITNVTSRLCGTCDQELMGELMNWFVWVGYVSSGVNPCVYTLFSRRFRKTFWMLLRCKISEISSRKERYSRRGSSGVSIRSTGRTGTKSSRASIVPPLDEVKELKENFETSPDLISRVNLVTDDSKHETTPFLDGFNKQKNPRTQWRLSSHCMDVENKIKKLSAHTKRDDCLREWENENMFHDDTVSSNNSNSTFFPLIAFKNENYQFDFSSSPLDNNSWLSSQSPRSNRGEFVLDITSTWSHLPKPSEKYKTKLIHCHSSPNNLSLEAAEFAETSNKLGLPSSRESDFSVHSFNGKEICISTGCNSTPGDQFDARRKSS